MIFWISSRNGFGRCGTDGKEGQTVKVLVIPDVHLKPWMFAHAAELLIGGAAEQVVCLMDIADDWRQQFNIDLYIQSYDAAIQFAKDYPTTLWCYGNHDVCYPWNQRETGYSKIAPRTVCENLRILEETLSDRKQMAFMHRIDNVLFSHGGLCNLFVMQYIDQQSWDDVDQVIGAINALEGGIMWQDLSPIWYRPQQSQLPKYGEGRFLQVVGHTPVEIIRLDGNIVSCDVFSTYSDGRPIGTQEFPVIDTITWEVTGVK